MRFLAALALLAIGFGAGWILRDSQEPDRLTRAERRPNSREDDVLEYPKRDAAPPTAESPTQPDGDDATDADPGDEKPDADEAGAGAETGEDGEEIDPEAKKIASFMRGMLPLLKMQSARDAREEAAELARLLNLDEHRTKQLAEVLAKDKVRKLEEGVLPMLEGKEPDEKMIAILDEQDGMTAALRQDLSEVLNANEVDTVATHYREKREKEQAEAIEAEVKSLAIPDLTADQERELRAMLKEEQGGGVSVSAGSSNPSSGGMRMTMKKKSSKEDAVARLDREYEERREKLARFLSPEQLEHLDRRHEEEKKEAKEAEKMAGSIFGGFFTGGKTEEKKPAEK